MTEKSKPSKKDREKIVRYLSGLIERSDLTQKEISDRMGFEKSHVITMFKKGHTKIPLIRIPQQAEILNEDNARFMRTVLQYQYPDLYEALCDCFGEFVTNNERALLQAVRKATKDKDVAFDRDSLKKITSILRHLQA